MDTDTIVAPATPPGEGGVAIVRVSGPRAEELLALFFNPARNRIDSHKLYWGLFCTRSGVVVDEVLAVVMRAPHSFTREDVVEVHCHGGTITVRTIVDLFVEAGARLARPGEFTLRAFMNGRLDLSQAEAVVGLIKARSDAAGRMAVSQLQGRLGSLLGNFRERLLFQLSELETHIDFSEEDITLPAVAGICAEVEKLLFDVSTLIASFESGRLIHEGARVLILGKPNVGKSSLLNVLLGESRAIVSDVPGTTRDTLEESLVLGGVPLQLIDTAGLRESDDPVEQLGVQRARDKIAHSDLVLLVVDGGRGLDDEDLRCLDACPSGRTLVVVNKSDLALAGPLHALREFPRVDISAKFGFGLEDLRHEISKLLGSGVDGGVSDGSFVLYERRHREALLKAQHALQAFLAGANEQLPAEVLSLELRGALDAFGEVTGETAPDEILDAIFSRFCIGK